MPKKKDSVALFEVIARTRGRQVTGTEKDREPSTKPADLQYVPTLPPTPHEIEPPSEEPTPRAGVSEREPIARIEGNRLRLSLNHTSCVIISLSLLVLLLLLFMLGRKTAGIQKAAEPAGFGSIENAPYKTGVLERSTPPSSPPEQTLERIAGKYYPVVQGLLGAGPQEIADAEKIQRWLESIGEPADVRQLGSQIIVWSLKGFDSPDTPKAKEWIKAIETIGDEYKKQGGKYGFEQGGTGQFIRYRPR